MKAARQTPLEELEAALDYHAAATGRGAMLEYLLIDGVNDSDAAADALAAFCVARAKHGLLVATAEEEGNGDAASPTTATALMNSNSNAVPYVNLIPYNPTLAGQPFGYETPSDAQVNRFHGRLRDKWGVHSLVRWTSANGRDTDGACGQLALSSYDESNDKKKVAAAAAAATIVADAAATASATASPRKMSSA